MTGDTVTSLAELAALAAKVEGFERPVQACRTCGGYGDATPGWRYTKCECEAGDGREWDNSPAALLMAVTRFLIPHRLSKKCAVVGLMHEALVETHNCTVEDIARAALVALLRAHGVEVAGE